MCSHELANVCSVPVVWMLNIALLLACQHVKLHEIINIGAWNSIAVGYTGLIPWQIPFPVLILRMISFSLDLHRLRTGKGGSSGATIPASGSVGDLKARVSCVPSRRLMHCQPRGTFPFANATNPTKRFCQSSNITSKRPLALALISLSLF